MNNGYSLFPTSKGVWHSGQLDNLADEEVSIEEVH